MGISIEWTFRVGEILTFSGTMIGGVGVAAAFLYRRGRDDAATTGTLSAMGVMMKGMEEELKEMKTEFKSFGSTLAQVAGQEIKINLLMKWYDELRNGIGIVVRDGRDHRQ
jgi:hypothetical protein